MLWGKVHVPTIGEPDASVQSRPWIGSLLRSPRPLLPRTPAACRIGAVDDAAGDRGLGPATRLDQTFTTPIEGLQVAAGD